MGDLRTLALVALDGSIDFLCWPRFDSPSVFASLLDEKGGGSFELLPTLADARRQQLYLPDTNVLLTRFLSSDGVAEISDFMTVAGTDFPQRLVRRIKAIRGDFEVRLTCAPRFDYGRAGHVAERRNGAIMFVPTEGDGPHLRLSGSVPLTLAGDDAVTSFTLAHGESACFTLDEPDAAELDEDASPRRRESDRRPADPHAVAEAFKTTSDWWRAWSARSTYRGRWRGIVDRSSLALKLLTSAEHGSIIAAGTFGLPETPGGVRNWDYRYTWIRDAAFTVYGFVRAGHVEEASAFMSWLDRLASGIENGKLEIMYRLDGSSDLEETVLEHFSGFRGAQPVRIGNGAHDQLQLDIYGELMDAIYLADKYAEPMSHDAWMHVRKMLDYVEHHWQEPDEGIWEVRNGRQEFLYSRLMCWVALDRGLRLARKRSLPGPIDRWRETRDRIHEDIHDGFWNDDIGAFVQTRGGRELDASCLLMPLVRFVSPTDPRWLSTLHAIGDTLTDDSMVYRYSLDGGESVDGLDGEEGTFNMCTFWYVECLARAGEVEKARFLFEKMLGYANHLDLFAEETGAAGEHLGNFPQAFTHLALISAAHCLNRLL